MNNRNDKLDSYELDKIRMKKMRALIDAQKRKQEAQERVMSIYDKIDIILRVVLTPEAYTHLSNLKENEQLVYQQIMGELVSPEVIQNIDYLLAIIQQRRNVQRKIPLDVIIFLERKVKGIKSKIQVKRGDDIMDLGSYLTK